MIDVKRTSIILPKDVLIAIKARAVEKGTTQNNIITEILTKEFKPIGNKERKIKAKKIQMPFINPDKKANSGDMIGIVKLDHETDAVELKNNIYADKARF